MKEELKGRPFAMVVEYYGFDLESGQYKSLKGETFRLRNGL